MVEDNGVEAPAEKKMRIVDDSDITGKGKTSGSLSELKTLESFCFKEVLGSLPEEKVPTFYISIAFVLGYLHSLPRHSRRQAGDSYSQ